MIDIAAYIAVSILKIEQTDQRNSVDSEETVMSHGIAMPSTS
jgi:hypothetical protein